MRHEKHRVDITDCESGDVSEVMRAIAELAAEPFKRDDDDDCPAHIIEHFNGHRIIKRLIYKDIERMKHSPDNGKSFIFLNVIQ